MKKSFLLSIALLSWVASLAQTTTSSVDQQRRGTIIDPRQAGTAVLTFSERGAQRDYTQPVIFNTLPSSGSINPAFILLRSNNIYASTNSTYNTYIPDLSLNSLTNMGGAAGGRSGLPGTGALPGTLMLPGINIPGLPLNLPTIPTIINPILPIIPKIIPGLPGSKPGLPPILKPFIR